MTRRTKLISILAALLLVAAACGNSEDNAGTDDGGDPTTTAAPSDDGSDTDGDADGSDDDGDADGTDTDGDGADTDGDDGDAEGTDDDGGSERDTFVALEGVPGVDDDEIRFAAVGTQANNPLGTCVLDCYSKGIEAYFEWRNSEGGIYGRQLVLSDVLDDELAKNLERSTEVIAANNAFGSFNATQVASGWQALEEAGIPTYVWNIHAVEATGKTAIFPGTGVNCADCISRLTAWLMRYSEGTSLGSFGYGISENSKVCSNTLAASIEAYGEDIGGATVGYLNDDIAFGLPNGIGPEVTQLKDAGVDYIDTCIDLNGMKTLAQELVRQGIRDQVRMHHPNTYNQTFVAENADLFEGDTVTTAFVPLEYDAGLEQQDRFLEFIDETALERGSELAMTGWINADLAFEGLLAAGPEFDRQSVIDATNLITDWNAGGLIQPVDWTRQHNPPSPGDKSNAYAEMCITGVVIRDGAFEILTSDPTKPWICFPNDTDDWSEPVETSFAD